MNFSDSEIVASLLRNKQFEITSEIKEANVVLINTCSVRDHAEERIRNRIKHLAQRKKKDKTLIIGIIGCMAERLKEKLLEEEASVDIIVGPDAYRDLPKLLNDFETGQRGINVLLSSDETYADISPIRYASNGISAFISIMRGCENFCSYCVVPFTRGKERSRDPETILEEAKKLYNEGYREITLLGQNVNSYQWDSSGKKVNFAYLLNEIAQINSLLRIRFATSHPKDISDELIQIIAANKNICKSIHLPVQSGSTRILRMMNRKYTREFYLQRIESIKKIIPDCSISTDIIVGFCSETELDFQETISLMETVEYCNAFMFKYSERPDTTAKKAYKDDILEKTKLERLQKIILFQQKLSLQNNKKDIGKIVEVLVEQISKRSSEHFSGRNSQNKMVVFPKGNFKIGDYVKVKITKCTTATLIGESIAL